MIIDILSDLHVDFYFKNSVTHDAIKSLYAPIFTDFGEREVGDVLIVAGDIGHYNEQSVLVLKMIREVFGYSDIICVLGNHDYYLLNNASRQKYSNSSLLRVEELRNLINEETGLHCLDGNSIEIEGIRFAGCDGWYDGAYIKKHFKDKCILWNVEKDDTYINSLWKHTMADAHYIFGINWQEYANSEREKIEKIYKDVDVMITHINPSIEKEHTGFPFKEEETTGFFTFDGTKYLKNGSMKYWIYGHTHAAAEHVIDSVHCICNPMGYPNESHGGKRTIIAWVEV